MAASCGWRWPLSPRCIVSDRENKTSCSHRLTARSETPYEKSKLGEYRSRARHYQANKYRQQQARRSYSLHIAFIPKQKKNISSPYALAITAATLYQNKLYRSRSDQVGERRRSRKRLIHATKHAFADE
jgi:hypothetical protein